MSSLKITDFKLHKIIGTGGYAIVYAAEYNNKMYALKASRIDGTRFSDFGITEKNILKKLDHPFIIKMLGCFRTETHLYYAMEYAPGGNILYWLDRNGYQMPLENAIFYGAEIALAISHLHSNGIVHRDIKPQNILIAADGHIKLIDFGSSAEQDLEGKRNSFNGTFNFMAPEVVNGQTYSYEIDWWSFGVTLYIMLYGEFPFAFNTCFSCDQKAAIIMKCDIAFPNTIPEPAVSLLKGLLNGNPSERLGKDEICSHPFFANIDWQKLKAKEITPPFIPQVQSPTDFQHFDPDRVYDVESLTESPFEFTDSVQWFKNFDYLNPNWKD